MLCYSAWLVTRPCIRLLQIKPFYITEQMIFRVEHEFQVKKCDWWEKPAQYTANLLILFLRKQNCEINTIDQNEVFAREA